MPIRKTIFWIHLVAGVAAGLVIFILSLTGVLLAFERQAIAWAERDMRGSGAAPDWSAVARVATGVHATNITISSNPATPLVINAGRERMLFVDRANGSTLGDGATKLRHFFRLNEDLHRWLALKDEARPRGRAITGAANFVFLFILVSGLYLWIPRSVSALRSIVWFRRGLRGKARDFNWHNALGIWSALPLILIVTSGIVMSYPWATRLVYVVFGGEPPQPRGQEAPGRNPSAEGREGRRERGDVRGPNDDTRVASDLARMLEASAGAAANAAPNWKSLSLRLPIPRKGPMTVSLDEGSGARPDLRSQLLLDPKTGAVVEHKRYRAQSGGQKARAWLRWIHTGEAGGLGGQIVAMLASAAALVLVYTGISLALRRFRNRKRKEASA